MDIEADGCPHDGEDGGVVDSLVDSGEFTG